MHPRKPQGTGAEGEIRTQGSPPRQPDACRPSPKHRPVEIASPRAHQAAWTTPHSPRHRSPAGHWRRAHGPPAPRAGPCAGGCHQGTGPGRDQAQFLPCPPPLARLEGLGWARCKLLGDPLTPHGQPEAQPGAGAGGQHLLPLPTSPPPRFPAPHGSAAGEGGQGTAAVDWARQQGRLWGCARSRQAEWHPKLCLLPGEHRASFPIQDEEAKAGRA